VREVDISRRQNSTLQQFGDILNTQARLLQRAGQLSKLDVEVAALQQFVQVQKPQTVMQCGIVVIDGSADQRVHSRTTVG
jgi:N-acetyl-gamma-glutamylphosphate reductase